MTDTRRTSPARPDSPVVEDPGVPTTLGDAQRAAAIEPQLFRGQGVHAADTVIDHGTFGGLTLRAASVRGTYGRYSGGPREDDYALGHSADGGWLVVAVADGVSSAGAANLASTLAVRTAVQQAIRVLDDDGPHELEVQGVFQSAAYQLRRAAEPMLEREGLQPTPEALAGLMATTLLLAVVPTDRAPAGSSTRLARVGDSNAWLLDGRGWHPLLQAKAADVDGLASAAVQALPRLPTAVEETDVVISPGATLVLATDGVTDPFGADLCGGVARTLHDAWHPRLPAALEFARQVSFRGQSWDDDRTAVAIAGIGGSGVGQGPDGLGREVDQVGVRRGER